MAVSDGPTHIPVQQNMKKLFLIDAYALIFRFYYAFIGRPMRNAEGMNTSAIFGFVKYINDIIRREQPDCLGVAFDPPGGNFRHDIYPEYKANRSETPEEIIASVPYIKRILEAMRIPILEVAGFEADDVIGTLSREAAEQDFRVYMVTPDKDYGQLIRPEVYIYKQRKGGSDGVEIIGCDQIHEHYGIDDPKRVIDILALWGDASDNIPGVPGIGEKSAIKLVCQYGPVEQLLENIDKLSGKQRENIAAHSDQILLAKRLATIEQYVPIAFEPEKLVLEVPDKPQLIEIYKELGFRSFIRELQQDSAENSGIAPGNTTPDLFSPHAETPSGKQQTAPDLFSSLETGTQPSAEQGTLFSTPMFDTVETLPHTYRTVETLANLEALCRKLESVSEFCFDTETTGFDIFNDRLVGISIAIVPHEAWYIPCQPNNTKQIIDMLRPVFENESIAKIGQNIKFDLMVLRHAGLDVRGRLYDTMIIHYLLDPESRHGMDHLAITFLNYTPIPIEELIGKGARQITMDRVPVEKVSVYAAEDADVTLRLKLHLWPMLVKASLDTLYLTIEEPLIRVLADIEMTGVKIDTEVLAASGRTLSARVVELENSIREMCGDPSLNINSARQLGEALFNRLKIDPNPKKTKTKQFRTDEEYLQMLTDRHPVVGAILEYRGIKKLLSTYIEALPQLINPSTGRIHTSFNQAVSATGRLSSTNPNLQNIPVRDEQGREIRKAFVASDDNHLLLSADYSQVELRLMAHLSGDPNLLDAFAHDADIHTATAAKIYAIPAEEVTREQRRRAKTANFGIIYGISAFGLAQRLNIPRAEAKMIIDSYFATYPGVKQYMDRVIAQAHETGYVTTLFGRKRMLPNIQSGNAVVRGLAERNAINAPIQGSAADIMKLAMIAVHRELTERGLKSKMILQVHDELVIDLLKSEETEVREIVVRCMEHAAQLHVKLIAECGVGKNWVEAH